MVPERSADARQSVTFRLAVVQVGVALVFAALAVSFWVFQVAQHAKFEQMAGDQPTSARWRCGRRGA